MAILSIKRSNEFANKFRKISIIINGNIAGEIGNGETKEFEIGDDMSTVQAKIDWCTSNTVLIYPKQGKSHSILLSSFAKHNPFGALAAFYYVAFAKDKYLRLEEE